MKDLREYIDAVIVVEGKSDTARLQQFYNVETFETSGTGFNETLQETLRSIARVKDIVVLTDPDHSGEQIRRKVMEIVPTASHAILKREDARPKNNVKRQSLGVEHASFLVIDEVLKAAHVSRLDVCPINSMTQTDMIQLGLTGFADSKQKRDMLAKYFSLGVINGKQFLKRIRLFGITREQIEKQLKKYEEEQEANG